MNDTSEVPEFRLPLLELPAPCLRTVLLCLWKDVRDLASLSCCCRATTDLCNDQQVWKDVLLQGYGEQALPGEKPSLPPCPVLLEGWVFFPGLDASAESDKAAEGGRNITPQQLAEQCSKKGGEAFTTGGKIISSLGPCHTWRRVSFKPQQGTYVQQELAAAMQLRPPEGSTDHTPWPPDVPGWVYFPSCYSSGYTAKEASYNLSRHTSLLSLLAEADEQQHARVVAVTTEGETKFKLRPQRFWCIQPNYDCGMYVRESEVHSLHLTPVPEVPDYRRLAAKLHTLRLPAAQMSACWLDDNYLTLQDLPEDDDLGCGGTVLRLNNVWWLDISGSIAGVPPGRYEVSWVLHTGINNNSNLQLAMSATAEPIQTHEPAITSSSTSEPGPSTAAPPSSSSNSTTAAAEGSDHNSSTASRLSGLLQGLRPLSGGREGQGSAGSSSSSSVTKTMSMQNAVQQLQPVLPNRRWGRLSGGFITLSDISTVNLRFWSHDGWKGGMHWAYVELRPHRSPQQRRHEQQRKQQWQQWWQQRQPVGQPPEEQQAENVLMAIFRQLRERYH